MADQKISALTEVTAPTSSDMVPIVNSATTKKVQIQNLVKLGNVAIWARVFHNANQSISNNTPTALAFNSERADTDTIHDTVTNNPRLTCKTAGIYLITASIRWAANATGGREIFLRINGTTAIADAFIQAVTSGSTTSQTITSVYSMVVNDYVEVVGLQESGGSLNVLSGANFSPEFMMVRLGA